MLLLLIFTGCAGSHSWQALPDSSENERTIFVVSHGWHTGLILPYESLSVLPDLEKFWVNQPIMNFETSQSTQGMNIKYLMAGFLIIFALTMLIQFVVYFLRNLEIIKRK